MVRYEEVCGQAIVNEVPVALLAGTSEVAQVLGCPKQQLAKLRQRSDFPLPVAMLAATPVWDVRDVYEFKGVWTGRRKVLDSTYS